MTTVNTKKSIKTAVVVTYIIAVVLLVAAWFVPGFGYGQGTELGDMMMFWYVPAIINAFLYPFLGKDLIPASVAGGHKLPEFMTFESQIIPGTDLHIPALMIIVLLVITVLALIFLIPVIAGKKDRTCTVCAYIIEGAAIFALAILFLMSAWETNLSTTAEGYLNLVCVFAAILVVIFVQSIIEKKSYGVAKMFLFLFSAAAFLFAMFAVDNFIVLVLEKMGIENIWTSAQDALKLNDSLYVEGGVAISGLTAMKALVGGMLRGENVIWNADNAITLNIINVCVLATFALLALNLLIDFVGLISGNKYGKDGAILPHKGGKIFGIVRYALALAVLLVLEICLIVDKSVGIGVCGCFATLFVLINLVIDIIRLVRVPAQKRAASEYKQSNIQFVDDGITTQDEEQTDLIGDEAPVQPYPVFTEVQTETTTETTAVAQPVADEQLAISTLPAYDSVETVNEEPAQAEPYVYTPRPVVYNGPTDEFLDTLTTEEKIEFSKVFIDKTKGTLPSNMPEYEVGGSNDDFFPAIFINLGRFRAMLTSGLLRKIYKHLNSK